MFNLTGKVAFVTGAAMGNGEGIARALAARGARVVLVDQSGQVHETAADIGDLASAHLLDVSNGEDVARVAAQVLSDLGRVDILVNNAGLTRRIEAVDMKDDLWDLMYRVNVMGSYYTVKAFSPHMAERGSGRIINMSSVTGPLVADPGMAGYGMTKGGIVGFTKALAVDLARYGVTVNTILPGYIHTPGVDRAARLTNPENPQIALDATASRVPLGRLGLPIEIGYLAAFLASDEAAYITGAELVIDGGNTLVETGVLVTKERDI
jgi:NAD(P)-dependent dehydrogenase (short-subunit alcohol dehydrogenase family)